MYGFVYSIIPNLFLFLYLLLFLIYVFSVGLSAYFKQYAGGFVL